jgi:hypothetical protein
VICLARAGFLASAGSSPRCASSDSHLTSMRPTPRSRGGCPRWRTRVCTRPPERSQSTRLLTERAKLQMLPAAYGGRSARIRDTGGVRKALDAAA